MFYLRIQRFRKQNLAARKLLVLTFLLSSVFLFSMGEERSTELDKNIALSVAKNFYISMSSQSDETRYKASAVDYNFKLVHEEFATSTDSSKWKTTGRTTPLFYVINVNSDDGFVIVSGHENVKPILAYAFRGAFNQDEQHPAFRAWIEHYKSQIQYALENKTESTQDIKEEWHRYKYGDQNYGYEGLNNVAPLLSTRWNQNYPYSMACPADKSRCDGRAPAGCVALAMAQVLKFWEYPETCNKIEGYDSRAYDWINSIEACAYDWSMMPDELCDSSEKCKIEEVSKLIYHCGVSIRTSYGPKITAASSPLIPEALSESFSYKTTARYIRRENYRSVSWKSLLKTELDNGRPVLYVGRDPAGSHVFVCDGYQNSGHFHFNWGWSGEHDGYYYLDDLVPGEGKWNFSSNQKATIGIEPATSSTLVRSTENHKVFPNPVSDLLTIEFSTQGSHQLDIISLSGQHIFSEKTEGSIWSFDLSSYPDGVYFITIRSKDGARTKKIIKL